MQLMKGGVFQSPPPTLFFFHLFKPACFFEIAFFLKQLPFSFSYLNVDFQRSDM